jgi:hypothetical protein
MPAVSEKQKKFMDAVAHNKGFAKKVGVPQSVGADFSEASKGMKFGSGASKTRADRQEVNKPKTDHGDAALFKQGGRIMAKSTDAGNSKTMQKVKTAAPSKDGVASKGKTKGVMPKMAGNVIGNGKPVNTMKKGGMAKAKR